VTTRPPEPPDPIKDAANCIAEKYDTDVFLYNSGISRPFDQEIIAECSKREKRTNVTLVLITEGGNPDAAYRIARCFQEEYNHFTCLVPGYCKSSGTLILTGANELAIDDAGELGPLDVQMTKKDELWETESGLTVTSALKSLRENALSSFEQFFLSVKMKSNDSVTFKTAAEFGVKLTTGLFAPIFQQIDPTHVGEASRAQAIGLHYSLRLSMFGKNISGPSLKNLISEYPAHGFVIDRTEAEGLFDKVRKPNPEELNLIGALGQKAFVPLQDQQTIRTFICDEKSKENVKTEAPSDTERRAGVRPIAAPARESAEREDIAGRPTAEA
jgi:hypothetical protein